MYKFHHANNNTDIYKPNTLEPAFPHVISIGHSFPPCGYEMKPLQRDCYVLHYVVSGKGVYLDQPIDGPCAFIMTPDKIQSYNVDDDPNSPQWEQYWIMFSGAGIEEMIDMAGLPKEPACFPCSYIKKAIKVFQKLQNEKESLNQNDCLFMTTMLFQLFTLHSTTIPYNKKTSDNDDVYVQTICDYIHQNYAIISKEEELARLINFSTYHTRRIFKKKTGTTPMHYLTNYRIHCAKKILQTEDIPIYEVSEAVGFSNPNYFCLVFKKYCDQTSPEAYRKQHRLSQEKTNKS